MTTSDDFVSDDMILNYHLMHPGGASAPGDPNAAFCLEGTVITLEDLGGKVYKGVEDILDRMGQFTVGAVGECTETDVYITLRIGIETKVTANPL